MGNEPDPLRQRDGDQPLPIGNDMPICHEMVARDLFQHPTDVDLFVAADIDKRLRRGIQRYGQPLQPFNGRDFHQDAYEEVLDACAYVWGAVYEARAHGDEIAYDTLLAYYKDLLNLAKGLRALMRARGK